MPRDAVKVSVYINEGDEWNHRPLHLAVLRMLHERGIAGGTVLHAVAGFTGSGAVQTTSLVDAGGKLPLVIEFIDSADKVDSVMPELKRISGNRLIVRARVEVEGDPRAGN
jgi:PII-like signaling protein